MSTPSREARPTLPPGLLACLFDLDGVLTRTASLHAAAWKAMFDAFLAEHARQAGTAFTPFDIGADYERYVDGRPREDGTRAFLASRGIELPEGSDDDPPGAWTIRGLGRVKNDDVLNRIRTGGVEVFEGSVDFVRRVRAAGLRTAVVSSSKNTLDVLRATGLESLFGARVDGVVAGERGLPGKPAPDTFLAGAAELGVPPGRAAVFEDATAGVEAGRAGGFAVVVGVDRSTDPTTARARAQELRAHGADLVVRDLSELDVTEPDVDPDVSGPRSAR
jgi:beta-phosphoglucomutase family hydrolase